MSATIKLPKYLSERLRVVTHASPHKPVDIRQKTDSAIPTGSGRFVLYWTSTALRVDENPALDVACVIARQLKLPLLVYHGLSERYRYASDRHHLFILQGARQLQSDLAARNIAYAFHLESPADDRPHLIQLAEQAAIVVTEDMPVDPPRRFLQQLGLRGSTPIIAVDTACVMPMRLVGKADTRAFQFREATQREYDIRVRQAWPDAPEIPTAWDLTDLPFQPLDLQSSDLAQLIAGCRIDHAVGPVLDTIGGSKAGEARWNDFRQSGLKKYHQRRNQAELDGVSRLSAYFHYGMIAATRVAREATAIGGPGAEKYLDELLVWRELAYAFCNFRPDHDSWQAVPSWARETLDDHRHDQRLRLYDWETLARGQTDDELWNACQHSLLMHGELHNNLRMTWGKAFLNWTCDGRQALRWIVDLNHRYALDGRDPSSYGGILWCLGQFDRPFAPAQPIWGTVRPRSTRDHAKRIDLQSYKNLRLKIRSSHSPTIAVIGAGISGLIAARTLQDHGLSVRVFEKSRGISGRAATRRAEQFQYDHGAQYFTARAPNFRRYVKAWIQQGWVMPWGFPEMEPAVESIAGSEEWNAQNDPDSWPWPDVLHEPNDKLAIHATTTGSPESDGNAGTIVILKPGAPAVAAPMHPRFVACPGMNAIGNHLATGATIARETQVAAIESDATGVTLTDRLGNPLGRFDRLIVSIPAPQSAVLLRESQPVLAEQLSQIIMQPCWAVMFTVAKDLNVPWSGAFVHDSPVAWICQESTKPGRSRDHHAYVIHASAEWTVAHLEAESDGICGPLIKEFFRLINREPVQIVHQAAHRWRYSIAKQPLDRGCLIDDQGQIIACGDWACGSRIEGAFLSGMAAAGHILRRLEYSHPKEVPQQLSLF